MMRLGAPSYGKDHISYCLQTKGEVDVALRPFARMGWTRMILDDLTAAVVLCTVSGAPVFFLGLDFAELTTTQQAQKCREALSVFVSTPPKHRSVSPLFFGCFFPMGESGAVRDPSHRWTNTRHRRSELMGAHGLHSAPQFAVICTNAIIEK